MAVSETPGVLTLGSDCRSIHTSSARAEQKSFCEASLGYRHLGTGRPYHWHAGDWGDLDEGDKQTNESALRDGMRILFVYGTGKSKL